MATGRTFKPRVADVPLLPAGRYEVSDYIDGKVWKREFSIPDTLEVEIGR